MGLLPSWMDAHSVQPYFATQPEQPGPGDLHRARAPEVGRDQHVEQLGRQGASLQMLPSSKQASLLPEYS